jgi:mono/diheme cytochrome c family protein
MLAKVGEYQILRYGRHLMQPRAGTAVFAVGYILSDPKEGKMTKHLVALGLLLAASGSLSRVSAQAADGKAVYQENCRKCHGVIGTPPVTMKKKFPKIVTFDARFIATRSDDSVVKILTKGKGEDMVSFKDKMTAAEMTAVAKYVRELASKPHA